MAQPRISGFLNNCPMHVGVPELILGIRYFANEENPEGKISVNEGLNGCKKSYEQLKKSFEEFYQLEKLSWKQFFELVTTKVNNNSTAAQIMLGPVLRLYMSSIGFEKNKCELRADGKFAPLFSTDVKNIFQNFGINVKAHERNPDPRFTGTTRQYLMDTSRKLTHEAYKIDIYNEGTNQHWERCAKDQMATTIDGHATLERDSKPIRDAMVMQSLSALKAAVKALFSPRMKAEVSKTPVVETKKVETKSAVVETKKVATPKTPVIETKKMETPKATVTETKIIEAPTMTDKQLTQKFAEDAATRYVESLKKRKIEEKSGDVVAKKENVRQLVIDLFNLKYNAKPIEVKADDTAISKQIAEDEALARKLQSEEVNAARRMKL